MKYKYNGQWVDVNIKALDSMAIGCIIQFMGTTIPTGWLECDGSTITQANYPELYDLIGGTLPDFRGRVLVGQKTSDSDFDTLGETGGSKELQQHSHTTTVQYVWNYSEITGGAGAGLANWNPSATHIGTSNLYSDNAGSGNSGNLQPYGVVKHIIKAKNTVPTMASIVDAYSTSTNDGYSCNYVNGLQPVELYTSTTGGSNTSVTLSDSAINYKYIEIIYRSNDGGGYKCSSGKISDPNGSVVSLTYNHFVGVTLYVKQSEATINGTTIELTNSIEWYTAQNSSIYINETRNIYITNVIGYK